MQAFLRFCLFVWLQGKEQDNWFLIYRDYLRRSLGNKLQMTINCSQQRGQGFWLWVCILMSYNQYKCTWPVDTVKSVSPEPKTRFKKNSISTAEYNCPEYNCSYQTEPIFSVKKCVQIKGGQFIMYTLVCKCLLRALVNKNTQIDDRTVGVLASKEWN